MRNPFKRRYVVWLHDADTGQRVQFARRHTLEAAEKVAEDLNLSLYFKDRQTRALNSSDAFYFSVGKA